MPIEIPITFILFSLPPLCLVLAKKFSSLIMFLAGGVCFVFTLGYIVYQSSYGTRYQFEDMAVVICLLGLGFLIDFFLLVAILVFVPEINPKPEAYSPNDI